MLLLATLSLLAGCATPERLDRAAAEDSASDHGAEVTHHAAQSGTSSADAASVTNGVSQQLEAALKRQALAQARLEQAIERKDDAEDSLQQAEDELAAAEADRDKHSGDDAIGRRANTRLKRAERELATAELDVDLAEEKLILWEKAVAVATERVESLRAEKGSAGASAH